MQDNKNNIEELDTITLKPLNKTEVTIDLKVKSLSNLKIENKPIIEVSPNKKNIKHIDEQPPSTAQNITWAMLFIGWCITVFLYKKNKKNTQNQRKIDRHNSYVKEFRDLIFNLESNSIKYWTTTPDDNDQVKLLKFQREIKELTTKAKEIEKAGGMSYQSNLLIKFRRYVTLDNDNRPLKADSSRIDELRNIVSQLAQHYVRKSDY